MPAQTVLITGVSGYVGSTVAYEALTQGFNVRGAIRRAQQETDFRKRWPQFEQQLAFIVVGDLDAPNTFDEAMKGVDAVIHTASPTFFNPQVSHSFVLFVVDVCHRFVERLLTRTAGQRARYLVAGDQRDFKHLEKRSSRIIRQAIRPHFFVSSLHCPMSPCCADALNSERTVAYMDLLNIKDPSDTYAAKDWNPMTREEGQSMRNLDGPAAERLRSKNQRSPLTYSIILQLPRNPPREEEWSTPQRKQSPKRLLGISSRTTMFRSLSPRTPRPFLLALV